MEKQTMKKFRWFWTWQDRKAEEWLRKMSLDGWHLKKIGFNQYTFEKGNLTDYIYRLDFRTDSGKTHEEYVQFFEEAGWEYLGSLGTWRYFRQVNPTGKQLEIFTDNESKIRKYQRLLVTLFSPGPAIMIIIFAMFKRFPGRHPKWVVISTITIFAIWLLFTVINFIMIMARINELKKEKSL